MFFGRCLCYSKAQYIRMQIWSSTQVPISLTSNTLLLHHLIYLYLILFASLFFLFCFVLFFVSMSDLSLLYLPFLVTCVQCYRVSWSSGERYCHQIVESYGNKYHFHICFTSFSNLLNTAFAHRSENHLLFFAL